MLIAHNRIVLPTARIRWHLAATATIMSIAACGGDATGPTPAVPPTPPASATPGRLTVSLTTPNTDDGALLATLSGGVLDSITVVAGSTSRVQTARPSATTVRLIILAAPGQAVKAGELVSFWVPDVAQVARYSGSVEQVAARVTYAQRVLVGYSLRISSQ
jgi:hypothetical protein